VHSFRGTCTQVDSTAEIGQLHFRGTNASKFSYFADINLGRIKTFPFHRLGELHKEGVVL
jgi:hypothetical protein